MRCVRNGAVVLFAAMLMIGCAGDNARHDLAQQDAAKKEAHKKVETPPLPASIFQGYNVTGSRF